MLLGHALQSRVRGAHVRKLHPAEAAADAHGGDLAWNAAARRQEALQGSNPRWFEGTDGRPRLPRRTLLPEKVGHVLLRDRLAQAADAADVHCARDTLIVLGPPAGCGAEHAARVHRRS